MIELNNETKKAIQMITNYVYTKHKNECYDIETFYQHPSYNKIKAWNNCKELCNKYKGYNLHITGGNSNYFSAGFTFIENNKEYLCYITYANNYKIEL